MKPSFTWSCALTALLSPLMLQGQAESVFPKCRDDGTAPYGTQCECDPPMYRGECRNPEREFQLHLPGGVVAFGNCGLGPGDGVRISLLNPTYDKSGGGPSWDEMGVWASTRTPSTPKEQADRFERELKEDSERKHATDVEILPATQISLGSLAWIDVKASLVQPLGGKLFYEVMFAKDPRKDIDYLMGMICSAALCQKERQLFKSVVEGFTYAPAEHDDKSIKSMDADSNRQ